MIKRLFLVTVQIEYHMFVWDDCSEKAAKQAMKSGDWQRYVWKPPTNLKVESLWTVSPSSNG